MRTEAGLRFVNPPLSGDFYCNAQLDAYQGLPRQDFSSRPPLRLTLRARFSHAAGELTGTAGFGFWNDPFLMTDLRSPALPRSLWFFYAGPPSDMRLAVATPGCGWKASAIDALHLRGMLALPLAALAAPAMLSRRIYHRTWPFFERNFRIGESLLEVGMQEWHEYALDWQPRQAAFSVDGRLVLETPAPAGPLGFVAWLDNQYMVVHPTGRLRHGVVAKSTTQWMEISDLRLER